jgi:N-acyl-D-aspartate/D-glutamate deacylase
VAVKDGKIAEVSASIENPVQRLINAESLVVFPAFIDSHSHSDGWYIKDEKGESKIYCRREVSVT